MREAEKQASFDRTTMVSTMKGLWLRGSKERCLSPERRESMEPQLNHNDIHMEKNDKEAIECWTRFGTDLSESTPPPGGSSTVAL